MLSCSQCVAVIVLASDQEASDRQILCRIVEIKMLVDKKQSFIAKVKQLMSARKAQE